MTPPGMPKVMGTAHHNLPERRFMIVTTLIGHDGG
jgi:hypothetical protein